MTTPRRSATGTTPVQFIEETRNQNCPARVKQRMQWDAPFKPLAVVTVDDPLLLPERGVHAEIGIH